MTYLLISDCYYPSKKSISRHIYDLLKKISSKNKTVDFYFPITGKYQKTSHHYSIRNINFFPIRVNDFKKRNFFIRGVSELILPFIMWKKIKKNEKKIKQIIIFSPSIFFGLIMKALKKKFNCKIILLLRDVFPDWLMQKNKYLWANPFFLFAKYISFFQFYKSDVIAAQSLNDKIVLKKRFPKKKIKLIYNWITPKKLFLTSQKKKKNLNFVFVGTMGPAQNWNNIIELIKKLNENKLKFNFYFIGDGKKKIILKNQLSNFSNVHFINPLPEEKLLKRLKSMDVGIISLDDKIKFNNIPGKFFSYLESGLPILLDANSSQEISQIIKNNKIGLTNKKNENNLFFNAKKFINNNGKLKSINQNYNLILNKMFSTDFAYKQLIEKY